MEFIHFILLNFHSVSFAFTFAHLELTAKCTCGGGISGTQKERIGWTTAMIRFINFCILIEISCHLMSWP